MTEEEKYSLYGLIQKYFRNETIVAVEIGSYLGASSVFIARSLTIDSELHCIDTWGNDFMSYGSSDIDSHRRDTYSEFRTNTSRYRDRIIEHRQWSYDAIEQVRRQVKYIDFLFIDGDHNYDGVKKDWELYSPLLRSGSIVVFHDTGWADGVNRVIREDVEPVAKRILFLPNMQAFRIEPRW
jgi:predicted O-methyltransferase YrrM